MLTRVDHLVYAVPDLDRGIDHIESLTGVRATAGGQHQGRGTHNALMALGAATYLEIIAPDPRQAQVELPLWLGVDVQTPPRLVTWAANTRDLEAMVSLAATNGEKLGSIIDGNRARTDGSLLQWRYTDPRAMPYDGLVPFFIDWGDTPHPAHSAAAGASLTALGAEHPNAARVQARLRAVGLEMQVRPAERPGLVAIIDCPRGRIELR